MGLKRQALFILATVGDGPSQKVVWSWARRLAAAEAIFAIPHNWSNKSFFERTSGWYQSLLYGCMIFAVTQGRLLKGTLVWVNALLLLSWNFWWLKNGSLHFFALSLINESKVPGGTSLCPSGKHAHSSNSVSGWCEIRWWPSHKRHTAQVNQCYWKLLHRCTNTE